ncbi:hypothetical protein UFOVP1623_15 [uncultured Caudovirales phage]|uniref:Uncharacterized protein n=1 Tax=uncultured Caudovirales phage TaxID=2100421 RepID=A0A6J5S400_9CAUD|nr:hypothetical protein UFOVP1376_48 [uncultured Caudovirales phage]CAB4220677.1 hypothetical protein UFOVP1623_15 [uncultured Caudovirales phage]
MLIDVPVFIQIDAQDNRSDRPVGKCVLTMRFDPDAPDDPIKFCTQYPPKEDAVFWEDSGDLLISTFGNAEYKKLIAKAKANPFDYCSDAAEGERLQEIADAEREPSCA